MMATSTTRRKVMRVKSSSLDDPHYEIPRIQIHSNETDNGWMPRNSLPVLVPYSKPKNDYVKSQTLSLNRESYLTSSFGDNDDISLIKVHINLTQYRIGLPHGVCTLETLGIIPNRHLLGGRSTSVLSLQRTGKKKWLPVTIRGIIPGSPAALTRQLHTGDELISVNGLDVNVKNIEQILSEVSHEVIFDVNKKTKRNYSLSPSSSTISFTDGSFQTTSTAAVLSPMLLYLTLDIKETDSHDKDILFYYPFKSYHKLFQIRGAFLTLSNLVHTFSSSKYSSYSVIIENNLYHVSSYLDGKKVLLIALADVNGSANDSMNLLKRIEVNMKLLYGNFDNAFVTESDAVDILSLIFQYSPYSLVHSSVKQLPLPIKVTSQLSTYLNHLDCTSYVNSCTGLIPCGSCIFYKSYVICHHLEHDILQCVYQLCQCYDLLNQTSNGQHLHQLTTVWKCININNRNMFVLVIGMENTILCQVLETYHEINTRSLPIDKVKQSCFSILEEIHSTGLLSDCERRILLSLPALTSADVLLASRLTSTTKSNKMTRSSTGSIYSINTIGTSTGMSSDSDSESSISQKSKTIPRKGSSSMFYSFRLSLRKKRKNKSMQSLADSVSLYSLSMSAPRESYMLTAGMENHLLHYVCLDNGRGMMISPCDIHVSKQPVHNLLLDTFNQVSSTIHCILHHKISELIDDADDDDDDDDEDIETNGDNHVTNNEIFAVTGCKVIEYGVLSECSIMSTNGPSLKYWIIGRLFENGKELYVCYQENMSQTGVEMAFKLLFGSNLG